MEVNSLSKTYAMAGWRVGMVVGNARICAALARVKSYLDYGAFTPDPGRGRRGAERPAGLRRRDPRHLQGAAATCWWSSMAAPAGRSRRPRPPCSPGLRCPSAGEEAGSLRLLQGADRGGGRGRRARRGFGEYGEGYVRIGLVENEHRIRQAARSVKRFLLEQSGQIMSRDARRRARRMTTTWRLGVAGLGVVGGALVASLAERPDFAPAGARRRVTGVSAQARTSGAGGRRRMVRRSGRARAPRPTRRLRRADRRRRGAGARGGGGRARGRQAGRHRQQGADRQHGAELARLAEARACRCCSRRR